MALNVWRDYDAELFFVFEHKADYSLLLYLTFLLKRRPVFFLRPRHAAGRHDHVYAAVWR